MGGWIQQWPLPKGDLVLEGRRELDETTCSFVEKHWLYGVFEGWPFPHQVTIKSLDDLRDVLKRAGTTLAEFAAKEPLWVGFIATQLTGRESYRVVSSLLERALRSLGLANYLEPGEHISGGHLIWNACVYQLDHKVILHRLTLNLDSYAVSDVQLLELVRVAPLEYVVGSVLAEPPGKPTGSA